MQGKTVPWAFMGMKKEMRVMAKLSNYDDFDLDDEFGDDFAALNSDRQARKKRKAKVNHVPKKSKTEILEEIADTTGIEGDFDTTYKPAKHEKVWLYDSLKTFYQQALITDVLAMVKGGKEASVYRCKAHESTGRDYVAVKVYRPRMFRNLRNDKMYREGRQVLTESGRPVGARDVRTIRAMGKKTTYGQQVAHTSWLMHEYNAMQALYAAGADVPEPIGAGENAIAMAYLGDEILPAPPLHTVQLREDEAQPLFDDVLRNIALMLQQGMIHGDLSEYNILYWQGAITVIDFPQVVEVETNPHAKKILYRDIQRVGEYFNQFGLGVDVGALHATLWQTYGVSDDPDILYQLPDEMDADDT
jgi:RIO kinase 1